MGLKVIGAGFGRTGTLSLKHALEQLGFGPTHHMFEVIQNEGQAKLFTEAHNIMSGNGDVGKVVNWDAIYNNYNSAVDFPTSAFYKELVTKYPESKVILTVREPEKWYDSALNTIYSFRNTKEPENNLAAMIEKVVWKGVFKGKFEDKDTAIKIFNENIEQVKKFVPENRLLVFSVKEGWEPLCKFLNVPVPSTPFPRVNDRAEIQEVAKGGFSTTDKL